MPAIRTDSSLQNTNSKWQLVSVRRFRWGFSAALAMSRPVLVRLAPTLP
jgi:hypothetical protein